MASSTEHSVVAEDTQRASEDTNILSSDEDGSEADGLMMDIGSHGDHQSMSVATDDNDERTPHRLWGHMMLRTAPSQEYEYDYIDDDGRGNVVSKRLWMGIGVIAAISILAIFLPGRSDDQSRKPVVRKYKGAPQYMCPEPDDGSDSSTTIAPSHAFAPYEVEDFTLNTTTFRQEEYRNWGKTYEEVLEGMRHWKVSRYLPNLKTGDSIFESGCGIGLNLLMTDELLPDIRDLHLYGTDFGQITAATANQWLDEVLSGDAICGGKRGLICAADSTHLDFVPDNSFDLVFTGYLSPESDPWNWNLTSPEDPLDRKRQICESRQTDWKSQAIYELAQNRQLVWYAAYLKEMVRIAKPGVPVIVEMVPDPYCDVNQMDEWDGGVPHDFWYDHAGIWDIDVESIEFEKDSVVFPQDQRYHVFMRKNSKH